MSYTVDKYQANNLQPGWPASIPEGSINSTSTSLKLPGRGIPNYGELIAENFVHILENFAGPSQPLNPVVGQIWYDTSPSNPGIGSLKVFNGFDFIRISGVDIDTFPFFLNSSSGQKGDLKYYEEEGKRRLYVHNGTKWHLVSGLEVSNSDPINIQGNDGDKWFNLTNNKLFLKANGNWINLIYVDGDLNYEANIGALLVTIGSNSFTILIAENNIVAVISYSNIPVGSLPTNLKLPGGSIANMQLLFPNGLIRGLNFSNITNNSIKANPSVTDNFTISSHPGKLILSGPSNQNIEFDNASNKININSPVIFDNTEYIKLPEGSNLPNSGYNKGSIRYNNVDNRLEYHNGSGWVKLGNLSDIGATVIPSGTRMLFYQNSLPSGWSAVTGINDSLVRIVDSGGGSFTGGNDFSSVNNMFSYTITGTTDDHTLTINQIPLHGHPYVVTRKHEITARMDLTGGLMMRDVPADFYNVPAYTGTPDGNSYQKLIGGTGGNQPHNHNINIPSSFSLNIKYINVIVGQKA